MNAISGEVVQYKGMSDTIKKIFVEAGLRGFLQGRASILDHQWFQKLDGSLKVPFFLSLLAQEWDQDLFKAAQLLRSAGVGIQNNLFPGFTLKQKCTEVVRTLEVLGTPQDVTFTGLCRYI